MPPVGEGAGDRGGAAGELQPFVGVFRWLRTVPSEMPSWRAIWLLVCPAASRRSSSFCLVPTPARYASGHLLGQRGTYAWVEANRAARRTRRGRRQRGLGQQGGDVVADRLLGPEQVGGYGGGLADQGGQAGGQLAVQHKLATDQGLHGASNG